MPIVSSEISKIRHRGNGLSSWVREFHTDHNGDKHQNNYYCSPDFDTASELAINAAKQSIELIEAEKYQIKVAIQNGADPGTLETKHLTAAQKAKQAIRALMLGKSYSMLKAAQYIQKFSDAQIETHFSVSQRIRIRVMQNYVIDNQSVFSTDLREEL